MWDDQCLWLSVCYESCPLAKCLFIGGISQRSFHCNSYILWRVNNELLLFLFCSGSLVAWKQEQVPHNGDSGSPTTPFPVSLPEQGNGVWLSLHQRGTQCHLYTDNRMYMAFIKTTKLNFSFLLKYGQLEEIKDVLTLRHQLNLSLNSAWSISLYTVHTGLCSC